MTIRASALFRLVCVLAFLGIGGSAALAAGTPSSSFHQSSAALASLVMATPPGRNLYRLADELRLHPPRTIPKVIRTTDPNYPVGHQDSFWVLGEDKLKFFHMKATIRVKTPHVYLYVQNGLKVSQAALKKGADDFEYHTYPTDRALYGSEWTPGVDGDPHLTILLGNLRSATAAGFFSAEDEYPRLVYPHSNEREMFYINTNTMPGQGDFDYVLAHEFQHMIHFHVHPRDNAWTNEGMSMLAERVNGYPSAVLDEVSTFIQDPTTQLDTWSDNANVNYQHYGASYLFFSYLYDRFGRGIIHDLTTDHKYTDIALLNDVFKRHHLGESADQVFGDWVAANLVADPTVGKGQYGYKDLPQQVEAGKPAPWPLAASADIPPYAARYVPIALPAGQKSFRLQFNAAATVPLIGAPGKQGFWWGNRGDLMDTTMTRTVDLRHTHSATLHFQTWYDIEKDYDYGYVEVSTDGGHTWSTLRSADTTMANPAGTSYGPAYTGSSKRWLSETVNLNRYAGKRIDLRFEYITDDAVNKQGFALRGIAIPQIHFTDHFTGWTLHGFVPVARNLLPLKWYVRTVAHTSKGIMVSPLFVNGAAQGSKVITTAGLQSLTAVVYSAAPKTTVAAPFHLTASSASPTS